MLRLPLVLVGLLSACLPAGRAPADTSEMTVEGLFTIAIGDPAGGVGEPSYFAEVIDSAGTRYRIRADTLIGPAPGTLTRFSGARVRVRGRPAPEDSLQLWITRIDSLVTPTASPR